MGPFFYLKYDIPANPIQFNNLSFFSFNLLIPPRAIIFKLVFLQRFLNL